MAKRSRLPISLRQRAVGWMKMELSQIDTDRRHHVSRSMDQRFWDQYQSEDSVSRKHIPSRLLVTSSAEEHFLALSGRRRRRVAARCRSFRSIREKKFCYYGAKASPQCKSLCKAISCVRPPPLNGRQRRARLYVGEENRFPGSDNNALLYPSQMSPDCNWRRNSGRLLI